MTTLLSNFVEKVQTKHWQNLRRRTQKLDPLEKGTLLELLEDNLAAPSGGNASDAPQDGVGDFADNNNNDDDDEDDDEFAEEDYELLQRDLDKANLRLEELQSKHDFLQTRLETYRSKISQSEEFLESADLTLERKEAMASKIASYKQALQPIEETFRTIASELEKHQQKIESMQDRQLELKLKTQECQVVLDELCQNLEDAARLPYQDDEDDQELLATMDNEANPKDPETARDSDETDDIYGDVELAGTDTKHETEGNQEEQP